MRTRRRYSALQKAASAAVVAEGVATALKARDAAIAAVKYAIKKALDVGRLLRTAKGELEHGEFMQWVEGAELGVSYDTIGRWMKLAEKAETHGEQIENAQSVRQAYLLAGLLPEPESEGGSRSNGAGNAFLTFLTRSATHLQAQLSQRPLTQWPLEDRRVLRDRLAPLVEIYEQLAS